MSVADKVIGVYHFLGDRTPGNIPVMEPKPRTVNHWRKDSKVLVARVKAEADIRESVIKAVTLLGDLTKVIARGDKVMVKPNFNSPDPPPASTELVFLRAVVEMLIEAGAQVTIGESSGAIWRPTRNVLRRVGAYDMARKLGVKLIAFDDYPDDWVRVKIDGEHLSSVTMPRSAYEADKRIYLPCLKTHRLAGYSGALKLAFGFVHPGERRGFHIGHRGNKLAEVNLCWQPNLVIMDGRKAFVSGGPDKGQVAECGVLLASGDPVALDAEAVKLLVACGAKTLPAAPWELTQIATALKYGLGVGEGNYTIIE